MADPSAPRSDESSKKKKMDISIAGYFLTTAMVKELCLRKYGISEQKLKECGPIDCAEMYYRHNRVLDSPCLTYFHIPYPPSREPVDMWFLPARVAFYPLGTEHPKLPRTPEVQDYLDRWVPRDMLKMVAFKHLLYVQLLWPRGAIPDGVVLRKFKIKFLPSYRAMWEQAQEGWLEKEREQGVENPTLPPGVLTEWFID